MSSTDTPVELTIFAYNVGFGDCFLLRFTYSGAMKAKHILIDFGTTGVPKEAGEGRMLKIAADIADKCGGKLDAVVATHRHMDHISGFATKDGKGPGDIIRGLHPDLVLQPWTEALDAPVDFDGPSPEGGGPSAFHKRMQTLTAMHAVADQTVKLVDTGRFKHNEKLAGQLRFLGEDNLKNLSAVENLAQMSPKNVYGFHGCDSGLEALLPGITVHVLGPPTLRQTDTIRVQRAKDADEFWHLAPARFARLATAPIKGKGKGERGVGKSRLFPKAETFSDGKMITELRWISDRIAAADGEQLLGIVRVLDKQMNNTSLILLFKAGDKTLLFPGDAQIENWAYALSQDSAKLLDAVDVYKVGHHGSLNATPKSMWNRFKKRGPAGKSDRLTSIMSTMPGKHGSSDKNTEVPRRSLLKALTTETHCHSTDRLPSDELFEEIKISLA